MCSFRSLSSWRLLSARLIIRIPRRPCSKKRQLDSHEKASYVVPVTPSAFDEHLSSTSEYDVLVADVEEAVAVEVPDPEDAPPVVADASEDLSCATVSSAVFALLASTPVPAARPMTAADKRATMMHRTNSSTEQPHTAPFLLAATPWAGTAPAAAGLYGPSSGFTDAFCGGYC